MKTLLQRQTHQNFHLNRFFFFFGGGGGNDLKVSQEASVSSFFELCCGVGDSNFGDFSFRQKREVIIIVEETFKILKCQSTTITTVESRETQKYGK